MKVEQRQGIMVSEQRDGAALIGALCSRPQFPFRRAGAVGHLTRGVANLGSSSNRGLQEKFATPVCGRVQLCCQYWRAAPRYGLFALLHSTPTRECGFLTRVR